MKNINTFR